MIQIPWCRLDRIDLEVRKNEDLDTLRRPWWPPTDMTAEVRRKVSVRFVFIYFPDFSFWQTCWLAACFGMCCFIIREKLLLRWIFTQSIFCYFSIAPHTRKKKSFFLLLLLPFDGRSCLPSALLLLARKCQAGTSAVVMPEWCLGPRNNIRRRMQLLLLPPSFKWLQKPS